MTEALTGQERWIAEDESFMLAGRAGLTDKERVGVAEDFTQTNYRRIAAAFSSGEFAEIKSHFRAELKYAEEKKAHRQWVKDNHAIYDPHRKKWLVTEGQQKSHQRP